MELHPERLDARIARLDALLVAAQPGLSGNLRTVIERWRSDAAALRFHLQRRAGDGPTILAVLGGTGTGKSTLVNRLLGANVSATSFKRTFTAGPVALCSTADALPDGWLNVEHVTASTEQLPARGQAGLLIVVPVQSELTDKLTIVDTPDLDGDQPAHHTQADRAFRWAEAILFLVTPEKYQMTELLPYYRLARRYALPALYVMNKCEEQAVLQDYAATLARESSEFRVQNSEMPPPPFSGVARDALSASIFAIPRDDAVYEPAPSQNLSSLRSALLAISNAPNPARAHGMHTRTHDLLGRFTDQVLAPMRDDRRDADRLIEALRAMESPSVGVDVNPLTQQLQRRLQQRSILYLMGPQRMLDRVRQAPGLLARLPRVAWDYVTKGEVSAASLNPSGNGQEREVPDFRSLLGDQFAVLQCRIDDALRSMPAGQRWLSDDATGYAGAKAPPDVAASIADEELANLKSWLEQRWNATPRDTKALQTLLKYLPGGSKLLQWTEAAPYLLTIVLVTHHAFFGPVDLVVLGGYGLATWLTERLSNEVTARTRATNSKIAERFADVAHEQIERVCAWLDRQAPSRKVIEQLEVASEELAPVAG
jgi:hypothetical protein